jgi:hypothetical protein
MGWFGIGEEAKSVSKGVTNITEGIRSAFTGEIPPSVLAEMDRLETKAVNERWAADSRIPWWQSSRSIVLLYLVLMYSVFMALDSFTGLEVAKHWVDSTTSLLMIVIGAFFGGKSIEYATGARV